MDYKKVLSLFTGETKIQTYLKLFATAVIVFTVYVAFNKTEFPAWMGKSIPSTIIGSLIVFASAHFIKGSFFTECWNRLKTSTPGFFKTLQKISGGAAAAGVAIITTPQHYPKMLQDFAPHLITAGLVGVIIAQFTKTDTPQIPVTPTQPTTNPTDPNQTPNPQQNTVNIQQPIPKNPL